LRLHFGLGGAEKVEKLEIQWPNGKMEVIANPGEDRILAVTEGKGVTP